MSTIADRAGEQFGFCLVPESDFILRKLHEARWQLAEYPFCGIHSDLYWHLADSLGWIRTKHGSLQNVPFETPVIGSNELPVAKNIFVAWSQLFALAPDVLSLRGPYSLEGGSINSSAMVFQRDTVLLAMERVISMIGRAQQLQACLVWEVRYGTMSPNFD